MNSINNVNNNVNKNSILYRNPYSNKFNRIDNRLNKVNNSNNKLNKVNNNNNRLKIII